MELGLLARLRDNLNGPGKYHPNTLVHVIHGVLDQHEPLHDVDTDYFACAECSVPDEHVRYPCPTVQRIALRLGVS